MLRPEKKAFDLTEQEINKNKQEKERDDDGVFVCLAFRQTSQK